MKFGYKCVRTHEGKPPTVSSLLSRDSVHHVDPNELWILWKEFGCITYYYRDIPFLRYFLAKCRGFPQEHHENWLSIWNFAKRKASARLLHCQSFRSFCCSYPEIRALNLLIYALYKRHTFTIPIAYDGNNRKIWNFHHELFRVPT
jgi:hypothetical protein